MSIVTDHLRLDKSCQRKGCKAPARFCPVLVLRARRGAPSCHQVAFGLALCTPCGRALKVEDILSDSGWEMLLASAQKMNNGIPRRELTTIHLAEIADG